MEANPMDASTPTEEKFTYVDDAQLPAVSDDSFKAMLGAVRPYTLILKIGPHYSPPGPARDPGVAATILEHGKRNMVSVGARIASLDPSGQPYHPGL